MLPRAPLPRWLPALTLAAAWFFLVAADRANSQWDWWVVLVSRMSTESSGWLVVVGIGLAAFATAAGTHLLAARGRIDRWSLRLLDGAALGLLLTAAFPAGAPDYSVIPWTEVPHAVGSWVAMLGFPVAALRMRRALRDPLLSALAVASAVLTVAITVVWAVLWVEPSPPAVLGHATVFGLLERWILVVDFAWMGWAALRYGEVAAAPELRVVPSAAPASARSASAGSASAESSAARR